jgi:hypothetical protein
MILAALALAAALDAPAAAPASDPPTCREASAAIGALNDSRPAAAPLLTLQIVCQNGKAVRIREVSRLQALPPQAERTPNLYKVPERCKDAPYKVVDRYGRPLSLKLGDLPKGALLLAISRDVDGCPVLTVARGNPGQDNPNPPIPDRVSPAIAQQVVILPKRTAVPPPKL